MVRTLKRMNSLNILLSLSLSWIDLLFKNKDTKIYQEVESAAKPIKALVFFKYYRLATGLKEMFGHSMCAMQRWCRTGRKKRIQLSFFENFAET